ncbi:MAG TPA: alkaline phosphatase [Vicinamibacteria bacterium]|nr:alkaline phosphatase [Vicinamibacteria bacterium]
MQRAVVLMVSTGVFAAPSITRAEPTRVILFIGDGFGAAQTSFGLAYARMVDGRELAIERLMRDGNTGYALPIAYESPVTDSAAAATQISTGVNVRNETLGLDPDGRAIETIVEWAEERGIATGLVTNMRLSHATPAAFGSHQVSRYEPEPVIVDEMLSLDIDVLLAGGGRALVPKGRRVSDFLPDLPPELDGESNRSDALNRIEGAKSRGYRAVSTATQLVEVSKETRRLLGLFAASHLPYVVDRRLLALEEVPALDVMTRASLDVLERSESGFFLMVEAGRIDYAGHDNDAGTMLQEILEFDRAIAVGMDFQERHPETLIVVTADHGTGGFSFTYGDWDGMPDPIALKSGLVYQPEHRYPSVEHLARLGQQSASFGLMLERAQGRAERLVEVVHAYTALSMTLDEARGALLRDETGRAWTVDFRQFYGDQASTPACLLGRALARHTHVVWSTGGHTSEPVMTFARGPSAERLRGVYYHSRVYEIVKAVLESPSE